MANTKSSKARIKTNERDQERNRAIKSGMRTLVKKTNAAITSKSDTAKEILRTTVKALDKAAGKGILHKNAAARRKSRLMKKLAKTTA